MYFKAIPHKHANKCMPYKSGESGKFQMSCNFPSYKKKLKTLKQKQKKKKMIKKKTKKNHNKLELSMNGVKEKNIENHQHHPFKHRIGLLLSQNRMILRFCFVCMKKKTPNMPWFFFLPLSHTFSILYFVHFLFGICVVFVCACLSVLLVAAASSYFFHNFHHFFALLLLLLSNQMVAH